MNKDPNKLFDFINIMFDKNSYEKVKPYTRGKHFFMINRFCSINFPVQANMLQKINVNPVSVVDFWQNLLSKLYTKTPGWMYTKTAATKKKVKDKYVEDETIKLYTQRFGYSRKQVQDAIDMFGDKMITELKDYEKMLKQ